MKNLKRALSLVLATVMVIGMMVVGASAAGYNDFADRDEIVNKDAVSMLTTLKVIEGDGTGNFRPEGTFTREAMAKMISVIMNKGVNNNDLFLGANSGLLDLDQAGDWAKGHINYCYTVGMIAGDGAGHFFPQAKLTAVAAAKMLLVAIGYDPVIEGLVGDQWDIKTAALASKLNIFDGYTKSVNAVLSRDDAALLIYNAMDVEMVETYDGKYAQTFKDGRTILSAMYGVYKVEGVVIANEWAALNETDSDATIKAGKTTLDNVKVYGSTTLNTNHGEWEDVKGQVPFNVTTEADDLGKTVTLYVRKTTILANSEVLGYAQNDNVNDVHTTVANADTLKNYLKGTGLAATKNTEYYVNYGIVDAAHTPFNRNGIKVEVIDNNNDGDVEYILYTEEALSTVEVYNEKSEVLGYTVAGNKTHKFAFTDVETDADLAVGDLILYVEFGGRTYVTIPETVTGKISKVNRDSAKEQYATIDGVDYYESAIADYASDENLLFNFDVVTAKNAPGFTKECNFVLDSNGFIVAYSEPEDAAPNYALVYGSAWTLNAKTYEGQIELVMADGTMGLYDINWKASAANFGAGDTGVTALEQYLGTSDVENNEHSSVDAAKGTVIEYTIDEDDVVTIKSVLKLNAFDDQNNNAIITENFGDTKDRNAVAPNTLNFTLTKKYEAGDGYINVKRNVNNGNETTYAIDKNTIAFYYDGTHKAVATGWDNMGTIANGTKVQVWTVMARDGITKLAEIVLFAAVPEDAVATDWLLVLTSNYVSKDYIYLNVVFEDGTTDTIKVDRDRDNSTEFDKENGKAYMKAYKYTVDSDGVYDLSGGKTATTATLLKNGTLDVTNLAVYPTLTDDSNVWNVTGMTDASDDATPGTFRYNAETNAIIITTKGNKTVQTAWIWDVVGDEEADAKGDSDVDVKNVKIDDKGTKAYINANVNNKKAVPGAKVSFDVYVEMNNGYREYAMGLNAEFHSASGSNDNRYAAEFDGLAKGYTYKIVVKDGKTEIYTTEITILK